VHHLQFWLARRAARTVVREQRKQNLSLIRVRRCKTPRVSRGDRPRACGDAFVFGGPARLRYHGVSWIIPGSAHPELDFTSRFNLTFQW